MNTVPRDGVHSEFCGVADFPFDWKRAAFVAGAVRIVGGAGRSRHQFGRWGGFKIRRAGAGGGDNGKTGSRAVDRAAVSGDGRDQAPPFACLFSMVHIAFHFGRAAEHVRWNGDAYKRTTLYNWAFGINGDAFSDRQRYLASDDQRSGMAANVARCPSVAGGGVDIAVLHSRRPHFVLVFPTNRQTQRDTPVAGLRKAGVERIIAAKYATCFRRKTRAV